MLSAVDLDDDLGIDAGEFGDVRRDGVLAPEAPAAELMVAQVGPETAFGIRHVATKAAGAVFRRV